MMRIKTVTGNITEVKAGAIILGCFEDTRHKDDTMESVDRALNGVVAGLIKQGDIKGKAGEFTLLYSNGRIAAERIMIAGMGKKKDLTAHKISDTVAEACRRLRQKGVTSIASVPLGAGIKRIKADIAAGAVTEGAILGLYRFRRYITKKEDNSKEVKELQLVVTEKDKKQVERAIEKGRIIAESVNWARDLVNQPANHMTPENMAEAARELAREYGLDIEVLEEEQITQAGMGGLLGVSRGSQQPPRFIILAYKGRDSDGVDIALAGKGVTFDSGGISIKPSERMGDMKGDMAGGASVMATLRVIAQLKPKINVTALVPATENLPSGTAMKPGDIITAMNGKTIEVLNTDAEGRLILADALSYARKIGAKSIIDIATLTGACQVALGNNCTGAFTNNQGLIDKLIAAGSEVGEQAWQLPMFPEYREQLKSDIADIKNIGNRYGGAITAAKFLEDFVDGIPWVHLDIAGTADTDKEKGYLVKGATGVPVRTLVNFILSKAK
jgi:leucyl aminopeptidase